MKKTIISAALLTIACVAFAASPRVDRTTNPLALGASNSVSATVVVSGSPTNEYSLVDVSLFCTQSTTTVSTFANAYVATPTVFIGNATPWSYAATATLTATPTTTKLTVINDSVASPTVRFLIYGIKRVGYSQP